MNNLRSCHRTDLLMLFEVSRQQFRIHKICIHFSYIKYDVIAFPELNTKNKTLPKNLFILQSSFSTLGWQNTTKYKNVLAMLKKKRSLLFGIWQWLQILILFIISIRFSSFIEFFLKHFYIFRVSWKMEMAYFYLCFMTGMLKTIWKVATFF